MKSKGGSSIPIGKTSKRNAPLSRVRILDFFIIERGFHAENIRLGSKGLTKVKMY